MAKTEQLQIPFEDNEPNRHDHGGVIDSKGRGHEYPFVTAGAESEPPARGVAVDLGARARALATIMDFYAYNNLVEGMKIQSQDRRSDFSRRYGKKTSEVVRGAIAKRKEKLGGFHRAMGVLYPKDEMIKAGLVNEADADKGYTAFKSQMNGIYMDPGQEEQGWRRELVDKANASAENARKSR